MLIYTHTLIIKSFRIICIDKMIRKMSNKAIHLDDRPKKNQNKNNDNEYYLPHPHTQVKIVKLTHKEIQSEAQREKNYIKVIRKQSYNPAQTSSIAVCKLDLQNHSKQIDNNPPNKNYATKKVERKIRSTSNGQTPKKPLSKSAFKLQLTSRKRQGPTKRINLQIQTPTTKKPTQKITLQQMNFSSYYSSNPIVTQSKSIKTLKKPQIGLSTNQSADMQHLLARCKLVIQQYSQQLQSAKRENALLQQENRRLRQERSPLNRPVSAVTYKNDQ